MIERRDGGNRLDATAAKLLNMLCNRGTAWLRWRTRPRKRNPDRRWMNGEALRNGRSWYRTHPPRGGGRRRCRPLEIPRGRTRRRWSSSRRTSGRSWSSVARPATGRRSRRAGCGSTRARRCFKGGETGPAVVPGQAGREPARRGRQLRRRPANAAQVQAPGRRGRRADPVGRDGLPWGPSSRTPRRRRPQRAAKRLRSPGPNGAAHWAWKPVEPRTPPEVKDAYLAARPDRPVPPRQARRERACARRPRPTGGP